MKTYTQLQADIADLLARTDVNEPLLIRLGELELNRALRLQDMLTYTQLTPVETPEAWRVTVPTDLQEAEKLQQGGNRLEYVTPNQFHIDRYHDAYTRLGGEYWLTEALPLDLWYYLTVPVLSDTNPTNVFTDSAYDALFYLALSHGGNYMNDPAMAQHYRQIGVALTQEVMDKDAADVVSGAPLVQRQ